MEKESKFDPTDEKYKEVKDLPEVLQPDYMDVPDELGGGFVRESAQEEYDLTHNRRDRFHRDIKKYEGDESMIKRIKSTIFFFKEYLSPSNYHQETIDKLSLRAREYIPVEEIIESEKLLISDALTVEGWENMRKHLSEEDRVVVVSDEQCGGPVMKGIIDGNNLEIHICNPKGNQINRSRFIFGKASLSEDAGMDLYNKLYPFAFNKIKMASELSRLIEERKKELIQKLKEKPELGKSLGEIKDDEGEERKAREKERELEEKARETKVAEILRRRIKT